MRIILNHLRLITKRQLHSAYVVTPHTRAQEQEKQACYLTKTLLNRGSPSSFNEHVNLFEEERDVLVDSLTKCIIETNYFHRDEEFKLHKRTTPNSRIQKILQFKSGLSLPLLQNFLKVVWSNKLSRDADCLNKTFSYRPDVVAPWERLNNKLQVSGKHGHLLSGKSLLPLFSSLDEVQTTINKDLEWDEVFSPFFDLHQMPAVFEANTGFHNNAPYPCPQTLFLLNSFTWKARMNTGQGIFYSFAHALNYALKHGAKMGEDLQGPIPIQCIVFNGTSFFFICYQLNTLDFSEHQRTLKNIAWVNELKLYDQVIDTESDSKDFINYTSKRVSLVDFDRKELAKTFENEKMRQVSLNGFDRASLDLFISFMFNPLCRS